MINSELLEIIGPAFVAGFLIALTHAPLGLEVFKRGIIFMDLAIAQFAGLGLLTANLVWEEPAWWMKQLTALGLALLAASCFRLIERHFPHEQEAIIGSSFVLASSLAILILADQPHGGEEIQHLLSGQILFVSWRDVLFHAPIYIGILIFWIGCPERSQSTTLFFILFAVAVTSSVQLVGVYVVFASLILPSLAAVGSKRKLVVAWSCGIMSVVTGITISAFIDAPAGPVIVLMFTIVAILIRILNSKVKYLLQKLQYRTST